MPQRSTSEFELLQNFASQGAAQQLEVEQYLEQSFKGIGESLTRLGTVADTTGKQAGTAAATGEKNFGKFLGSMTGVATGALAIVGAIQAMQDSEGGTYGTLMGIAGILGGLGSIFGGISGLGMRASGGPVNANRPYIVGEQGPELFFPGESGAVVNNERTQALLRESRGAINTGIGSNEGGSDSATILRETRSVIESKTASLLKESREAIANSSQSARAISIDAPPKPLNIKYESQVINNVEYVTTDQFQKGMSQAAERGRGLTLSALQNSLKSRRLVGL